VYDDLQIGDSGVWSRILDPIGQTDRLRRCRFIINKLY
jgi:hypothetical protein